MAEENGFLKQDSIEEEGKDSSLSSQQEESTNQGNLTNQASQKVDIKANDKQEDATPRVSSTFTVSLLHRRLDGAAKGYEEILRIIHSTNLKNAVLLKKNFYEIELICKNALLELKGV